MIMEIAPGIHRIPTPLGERFCDLYLIVGSQRAVLFDTGVAGSIQSSLLPELTRLGIAPDFISHVVVSHCDVDHYGGLADVASQLPAAVTMAHAADAPLMDDFDMFMAGRGRPFAETYGVDEPPDGQVWLRGAAGDGHVAHQVEGGESLDLGGRRVRVVHVPGHSHGHLAVNVDDFWAISDAVLGEAVPLADGSPAFPPTYRYVDAYRATIQQIRDAAPAMLATAHYGVFEGAAINDFLDASMAFTNRMDAATLAAVRQAGVGGANLADLLAKIDDGTWAWPQPAPPNALAFPVVGHLERLAAAGKIEIDATRRPVQMRAL